MRVTRVTGVAVLAAVAVLVTTSAVLAAPDPASASGDCSKAEASAVVKQLRLGEPSLGYPVAAVLCGVFADPQSQTMVVTLAGPTGPLDWVVFRWADGAWQVLMRQGAGASITAAGSDIRQTISLYLSSDSHCCPTGGTKTRIWHWNGSRFLAGAWLEKRTTDSFFSPSRNIFCWMDDHGQSVVVGCQTWKPPQEMVKMGAEGRFKSRRVPAAQCGCVPDGPRTLAYGKQVTVGRFRCLSLQTGMRCTVIQSGKGFLIDSTTTIHVGP